MDVKKWLLALGAQAGCLGENEREMNTCLITGESVFASFRSKICLH
jgi:hypothetical protein